VPTDAGLDAPTLVDAALDAALPIDASQVPVACVDRASRAVFPAPGWQTEATIAVPSGDLVGERLTTLRPGWAADVVRVEGFPRRPVLVMPLAVVPLPDQLVTYAASRIRAAGRATGEAELRALDTRFTATISGDAVVVRPLDAFPRDVDEVLVGFDASEGGPDVVPACDASGAPDPTYASWRALWPGEPSDAPALVVRLGLARTGAPLSALDLRLRATPVLEVAEAVPTARTELGEDAPDDATAAQLRFPVATGYLRLPDYRRGNDPMVLAADGAPEASGTTEPGFVVALPATGTAPYPVVLFQHGGGQSPRELFHLAGPLAEAGFAFVAIDLPEHGHRAAAGGGSDLSFLDFEHPIHTRENFRQAVADHLAVLTGLPALEEGVATALGVPDALDESRVFYMGLSLGGITGSITSQASRELSGAALFVAGAGYPELLQYGLFTAPISRVVRSAPPLPWALLGAASIALDGADPFAYAQQIDDLARPPLSILQLHAIDDPLISDEASEQWARAFGAALVRPVHHEVSTLSEVDLPMQDDFVRDAQAATRAYVQCPMNGVPVAGRHGGLIRSAYAQEMVAHCFAGLAEGRACEVVDTGFAD
jgi:hypothetical protein